MKKRIAAVVLTAALAVGAAACGGAPTAQDRANQMAATAAKAYSNIGTAQASIDAQANASGCTIVAVQGGPLPSGVTAASLAKQAADFSKANPGMVAGVAVSGKYGAVVILDCTTSPAPSPSA